MVSIQHEEMKLNTLSPSRDLFQSATWQFTAQARLLFLRLECKNYFPCFERHFWGEPEENNDCHYESNLQYVSQDNGRLVRRLQRPSPMSIHKFSQLPDLSYPKVSIIKDPLKILPFSADGKKQAWQFDMLHADVVWGDDGRWASSATC